MAASLVLVGCGSQAGASAASGVSRATVDPVPATTVTTAPPTTVPLALVDACSRYVPFAAFTGDVDMKAIWDQAGQSVGGMRRMCVEIGREDPAELASIAEKQEAVDRFFEQASATTTTSPECGEGWVYSADGFCVIWTP